MYYVYVIHGVCLLYDMMYMYVCVLYTLQKSNATRLIIFL